MSLSWLGRPKHASHHLQHDTELSAQQTTSPSADSCRPDVLTYVKLILRPSLDDNLLPYGIIE